MPHRVLAMLQAATRSAPDSLHTVGENALREVLYAALAALASLLMLDLPFFNLLVFSTLLDLATSPWDAGRFVGLGRLPTRLFREWGGRLVVNAAILLVLVSLANALPRLFGYLIEISVAYAATRAGGGTLDHVLPADHPFRQTWAGIMRRVEKLWDVDDDSAPPPSDDPDASDEVTA